MDVGVRCGGKVAVSQPLLNVLERYAVDQQQTGVAVPKLTQVKNGEYGIITTKTMLKCYGKGLPWHFHFTWRDNNGKEK